MTVKERAPGLAPVPRPIPIVIGDCENRPVIVVLRVVERGHDDLSMGRYEGPSWREYLTPLLDHMIHEMRLEVGTRHGIWICHVIPDVQYGYTSAGDYGRPMMSLPRIASRLRDREPREWRTVRDESALSVTPDLLDRYELNRWGA